MPPDDAYADMNTVSVNVRRADRGVGTFATDLEMARFVATLMDSQFEIGPVKLGLDSIVGLIPVLGDAVSLAAGLYPIHLAKKYNLGKTVIWRMWMNLGLDFGIGLVPVIGDIADIGFKANLKNLKLLEDAAKKQKLL
jgi:hypothetical protein